MTKKLALLTLFFSIVAGIQPLCGAPDEYWISFISFRDTIQGSGPPYVMKIDVLGNVLVPPKKAVPGGMGFMSPSSGATALSQTDRFLIMFLPDARAREKDGRLHRVFRAVIEKQTLRLSSLRETGLLTFNSDALQVTQRKKENFIVIQKQDFDALRYVGIPLSSSSKILAGRIDLFPDSVTCPCEMGISVDGRIFIFLDGIGYPPGNLVLQPLDHDGNPVQGPVIAEKGRVTTADISKRINGDLRFLLYHSNIITRKLFLQVLHADTLRPVGEPDRLALYTAYGSQTAAIDPLGRFVVYVTGDGHPVGQAMLMFQAVDALGRKSGQPKIIADKVKSGLDILKE
ncbi:hypothetical protein L0156_12390 [bacterium]|nr:hypothetical protein [bacterium]